MEHETHNYHNESSKTDSSKKDYMIPVSIIVAAIIIVGALTYKEGLKTGDRKQSANITEGFDVVRSALLEAVIPSSGVELPVKWGNLGAKLVSAGAIDSQKFKALYTTQREFPKEYETLLSGTSDKNLVITNENAGYILNLFWALGLANKNAILDSGEMVNPQYGGVQNFASTGGWTIAEGDAMEHYSKHPFVVLTAEQQALVDKMSRLMYRPCCNNSTHFPDCNHGMAMLGFLELMASQGVSEADMYKAALAVNSYWFPENYLTIATYMQDKGIEWKNVDAKEILGINYSSASGYQSIASKVVLPTGSQNGSGCSVGGDSAPAPRRQSSGCGVN